MTPLALGLVVAAALLHVLERARQAGPGPARVPLVAARELSIVFSTLIGGLWLREGHLGPRLAAALVVLAGVLLVALAR